MSRSTWESYCIGTSPPFGGDLDLERLV